MKFKDVEVGAHVIPQRLAEATVGSGAGENHLVVIKCHELEGYCGAIYNAVTIDHRIVAVPEDTSVRFLS